MNRQVIELLIIKDLHSVELTPAFPTDWGYIHKVYHDGFEYTHGEWDDYENLDENQIEDLTHEVEMQIEADEKLFLKSQSL